MQEVMKIRLTRLVSVMRGSAGSVCVFRVWGSFFASDGDLGVGFSFGNDVNQACDQGHFKGHTQDSDRENRPYSSIRANRHKDSFKFIAVSTIFA